MVSKSPGIDARRRFRPRAEATIFRHGAADCNQGAPGDEAADAAATAAAAYKRFGFTTDLRLPGAASRACGLTVTERSKIMCSGPLPQSSSGRCYSAFIDAKGACMLQRSISSCLIILMLGTVAVSCRTSSQRDRGDVIRDLTATLAQPGDLVMLRDGDATVIVSPRLQGRIMTMMAKNLPPSGFVPLQTIQEGEVHPHMNNFGGIDRFWIGPEAGQYGIYFPPGAEFNRDTWQVPAAFDTGKFPVALQTEHNVVMERDMAVTNYLGTVFHVKVIREIGIITAGELPLARELGIELPEGVSYVGAYSDNRMTNNGRQTWSKESGLIGIWILGMLDASDASCIIAPIKPAAAGPQFNDEYFGKVSEEAPERIKVVDSAVVFRGDARRVGKFGLRQARTTGRAGSYDFETNVLTIVRFSLPEDPHLYGNSMWQKNQAEPYGGDAFQSYNNGGATPGELAADAFYELESASPVLPLRPGESVEHRHATYQFRGSYAQMRSLAQETLGVDLDRVRDALLGD